LRKASARACATDNGANVLGILLMQFFYAVIVVLAYADKCCADYFDMFMLNAVIVFSINLLKTSVCADLLGNLSLFAILD
jgi:hypothetical protein